MLRAKRGRCQWVKNKVLKTWDGSIIPPLQCLIEACPQSLVHIWFLFFSLVIKYDITMLRIPSAIDGSWINSPVFFNALSLFILLSSCNLLVPGAVFLQVFVSWNSFWICRSKFCCVAIWSSRFFSSPSSKSLLHLLKWYDQSNHSLFRIIFCALAPSL